MFLKLLIFALAALLIYKLLGGKLPSIPKRDSGPKKPQSEDEEAMVPCQACSVYVSLKESVLIGGNYYCSECAKKEG